MKISAKMVQDQNCHTSQIKDAEYESDIGI